MSAGGQSLWGHGSSKRGSGGGGGPLSPDLDVNGREKAASTVFSCDHCDRHADLASDLAARFKASRAEARDLQRKVGSTSLW
jgi:hypothetical protein